ILSADDYRRIFRRPAKSFHDELVGRVLTSEEWSTIDHNYWTRYDQLFARTTLASDARSAIASVKEARLQQTLLSMTSYNRLRRSVSYHDLRQCFTRI